MIFDSLMNLSANASFHSFDFIVRRILQEVAIVVCAQAKKNSLDFFSYIGYNNEYM